MVGPIVPKIIIYLFLTFVVPYLTLRITGLRHLIVQIKRQKEHLNLICIKTASNPYQKLSWLPSLQSQVKS